MEHGVVGLERLELSTSRLSGVRSNHLSYRPSSMTFTQIMSEDIQKRVRLSMNLWLIASKQRAGIFP